MNKEIKRLKEYAKDVRDYTNVICALFKGPKIPVNPTTAATVEKEMSSVGIYGQLLCKPSNTSILLFATRMMREKWLGYIEGVLDEVENEDIQKILDPFLEKLDCAFSGNFDGHCGSGFMGVCR